MCIHDEATIEAMVLFTVAKLNWLNVNILEDRDGVTLGDVETDLDEYSRSEVRKAVNSLVNKYGTVMKRKVGKFNRFSLTRTGARDLECSLYVSG